MVGHIKLVPSLYSKRLADVLRTVKTRMERACALHGSGQSLFLLALLLVMAVSALYGQFLWNPIVFDDLDFFREGSATLRHFGSDFAPLEVRWLPYATLAWTARLFGLEMLNFRVGNLLLHAATAVALFFFLARLFRCVLGREINILNSAGLSLNWMAFFAALLFALHPVAVYGAGYLIQRTIVMATLFGLLALLAYLRGLTEGRGGWLAMSVVFYSLAVLSKEHAIMLPALMLALTVLLVRPLQAPWKRLWGVYMACALIAAYVVLQKTGILGGVYEPAAAVMLSEMEGRKHPHALSMLTQSYLFFKYWLLWLLPNPAWMSVDMREPFAPGLLTPYWAAAVAFFGYGMLAIRLLFTRGRLGLLGFAMLFPWVLFFTEFSTVRIQESFVLYRSYLWMAGGFSILPVLVALLTAKRTFILLLCCGILLVPMSMDRLASFSHSLLLWEEAEVLVKDKQKLPGVYRIYYNHGMSLIDVDRYQEGLADLQRALTLEPRSFVNHGGVAVGYLKLERYPEAIAEFRRAIEMEPGYVNAYHGRGLANIGLGDKAAALVDFEKSCELGWKSGCAKARNLKAAGN